MCLICHIDDAVCIIRYNSTASSSEVFLKCHRTFVTFKEGKNIHYDSYSMSTCTCVSVELLHRSERRKGVNWKCLLVLNSLFLSTEREKTWPCTFSASPQHIPNVFNSHKQSIHMSLKQCLPSSLTVPITSDWPHWFPCLSFFFKHTHIIEPIMIQLLQCCNSPMFFFLLSHFRLQISDILKSHQLH